jgi:hypothetical protein
VARTATGRLWRHGAQAGEVQIPGAGLVEVVLEEGEEVAGVEAEAVEAVEEAEEAEQEEAEALFVETSSEEVAGLVQNAPSPTIYRSRMSAVPHSNPAKGWQSRLRNNLQEMIIIHGRGSLRLRRE